MGFRMTGAGDVRVFDSAQKPIRCNAAQSGTGSRRACDERHETVADLAARAGDQDGWFPHVVVTEARQRAI